MLPFRLLRRLLSRDRRGVSAVEFAMVLPLMMLFLTGTIQYGFMMFTYNSMLTAARAGARFAALGGANNAAVTTMVQGLLPGWVAPGDIEVTSSVVNGNQVRVNVTIPASASTVLRFGPMPETLRADVVMLQES
nr:TadE family protein [Polymorphobacter multimanifer]